ncbi:MAG: ATP synthase F0 subunit B [Nitrospirota bacterium]|nr:ATP synthase F0 subunit B [Nitrospirota bacterium]
MLDIHFKWFLLLVVNFLGLIYLLNILLFKPLLNIFREREDTIKGSLDAAEKMNARKEEGIATMNREIANARARAKEVFETMRDEGLEIQKALLTETEATASAMIQKGREDLRAEVEKAKQVLRSDVEKFSDEIVRKLVRV